MAQSDARFGFRANLSRDDHDLSQRLGFTSACGMLLPVWFDFASPGDSYYMKHEMPLLRSIQLLAPMMTDVKVHYETFFVPIQMIFEPAENSFTSIRQVRSSNFNPALLRNYQFPLFNFSQFCQDLCNEPVAPARADAYRLCDLFGLSPVNLLDYDHTQYVDRGFPAYQFMPAFFPWQICAYNAIWQYYYRLDDKEQFSNVDFNLDKFYGDNLFSVNPFTFMRVHNRPWDFDYFTSMYRSPIVSDANMQSMLPKSVYSSLTDTPVGPYTKFNTLASDNNSITSFSTDWQTNEVQSSAYIRQLFANEKLAMITGRTKKNYDSQVLAHYGVEVPHDVKHDITMIHHDTFDLQVFEVTSLASTADAPLGELAGKSLAKGQGESFKFKAPCHGVMMTIFSVEPKVNYMTAFDRVNAIATALDFPVPEFDRLGNVPMYRYECGDLYSDIESGRHPEDIIGWKERYYPFKRKPNKVTSAFMVANGVNNYSSYFINMMPFGRVVTSSDTFISEFPRPDLRQSFYIPFNALDAQCTMPFYSAFMDGTGETEEDWNKTPWLLYQRDPFIVDSRIECKKVSFMSKDGEPIYD